MTQALATFEVLAAIMLVLNAVGSLALLGEVRLQHDFVHIVLIAFVVSMAQRYVAKQRLAR